MEIKALRRHGWSVTQIAEEFDLGRGTVYAELCAWPAENRDGEQPQAYWAALGPRPLGRETVELSALVTILGCSRAPAIRFARTRPTTFERLVRCLDDLGGFTREILTDQDPASGSARPPVASPSWRRSGWTWWLCSGVVGTGL